MNISNKPLLLSALIITLTAGVTNPSYAGITVQPAKIEKKNISQKLNNQITVNILQPGALYISRTNDLYYFWTLDLLTSNLTLVDKVQILPNIHNTIDINLALETTAVLYSDNLIDQTGLTKIAFHGTVTKGKIAIPISKTHFFPLEMLTTVGEQIHITEDMPDLFAIKHQQLSIFDAVEKAKILMLDDIDYFKSKAIDAVLAANDFADLNQSQGDVMVADYQTQVLGFQDEFLEQVNLDLETLKSSENAFLETVDQQFNSIDKNVLPCFASYGGLFDNEANNLENTLDQLPDKEEPDPNTQNLIDQAEATTEAWADSMVNCIGGIATIENIDVNNFIDENNYLQISTKVETLEDDIAIDVQNLGDSMQQQVDAVVATIDTDSLVKMTTSYQQMFNYWISPYYLNYPSSPIYTKPGNTKLINTKPMSTKVMAKDAIKGAEQLCEDPTVTFIFNVAGFAVVIGTPWADQIVTGNEHSFIWSLSGDDCIESHAGLDIILADKGDDRVYAGDGHDLVHGGQGDDEIHGSAGNSYAFDINGIGFEVDIGNLIIGGAGDDDLYGGEISADTGEDGVVTPFGYTDIILGDGLTSNSNPGNDHLFGEGGIDFLFGQAMHDTISNPMPGVIEVAGINLKLGSWFFGNGGNDTIIGSNTPFIGMGDMIIGDNGNDIINAGSGNDYVFAGLGDDVANGNSGRDYIIGSGGNDNLNGGEGSDIISAGPGNDTVHGNKGLIDIILGGNGQDTLFGDQGVDFISGGNHADIIQGNDSLDFILGGSGNDNIQGNDFVDIILGNSGSDLIYAGKGIDLVLGNSENDVIYGESGTDVILGGSNIEVAEQLFGGDGIDIMIGGDGIDQMFGGAKLDIMIGSADDDQMNGGDGVDFMFGGDGHDIIEGENQTDIIGGGDGNDLILGGPGSDIAFGSKGCDNMNGGDQRDVVIGGDNNDIIAGGHYGDFLMGGSGADTIYGNNGIDVVLAGAGNDFVSGDNDLNIILGGSGHDYLLGGNDRDVVFASTGHDFVNGSSGKDIVFGGKDNDIINGGLDNDFILGGQGDDFINLGGGRDFAFANRGNDSLRAVEGKNFASGNRGDDTLDGYLPGGNDARDILHGGRHDDNLSGNKNNKKDLRLGGLGNNIKQWDETLVDISSFNVSWTQPACDN